MQRSKRVKKHWLGVLLLVMPLMAGAQKYAWQDCYASLENDVLHIGNSKIKQEFQWNNGNLILTKVVNQENGTNSVLVNPIPDLFLKNEPKPDSATWRWEVDQQFVNTRQKVKITITQYIQTLIVQRVITIYPKVPAIATHYQFKGSSAARWLNQSTLQLGMIEDNSFTTSVEDAPRLGSVSLSGKHYRIRAVSFQDATDHHNNLVREQEIIPYHKPITLAANVLLINDDEGKQSFFVVKESPLGASQQAYPGFDFVISRDRINITGVGVSSADLHNDWTTAYGYALGLAEDNQVSILKALRQYQKTKSSEQDEMVLMNTWGDRGRDSRMSESFVLAELEKATKLGITHLQLDDGWQAGLSRNSANKQGLMWDDWTTESWLPHPQRFPNGLGRVVQRARELNIEIGLWFNPSKANSYRQWQRDAKIISDLHQQWGIRVFKIDGIELADKKSEENVRRMFDAVKHDSEGRVIFNLDVTAGKRLGYHYFTEYGNIFLENRYTDWGNYYPHWTLRNLWQLARYVPPEKLQIEFLNKWRNTAKYPVNDSFAPQQYSFEYLVAITLMAQPLAWLEAANLPEEAYRISDLLNRYHQHRKEIHKGIILPVGEEPDGTQWTGFQSKGDQQGYFLVFREATSSASSRITTFLQPYQKVRLEHLAGDGKSFTSTVDPNGRIEFSLPKPRTFALYRYIVTR